MRDTLAKLRSDMDAEFEGVHDELQDHLSRLQELERRQLDTPRVVRNVPKRKRKNRQRKPPVT